MAAKRSTARSRAAARRRKPATRKHPARRVKIPRSGPLHARLSSWLVLRVIVPMVDDHKDVLRSRKDAAILRATHEGCPTCHGNGQIFTKGKDGSFTGSKPCPAKPTRQKVSRWAIYKASRFGGAKTAGLVGWACPCGKKEKPRYRDAKEATKALRTHERAKHGGKTVGGAWYAQANEGTGQAAPTAPKTVSKVVPKSGMSDKEWEAQNTPMDPAKAAAKGICWCCGGKRALYSAFGGEQIVTACPACTRATVS